VGEIPRAGLAGEVSEDLRTLGEATEEHTAVFPDVMEDEVSRQCRHAPLRATGDDGQKVGGPAGDGVEPDLVRLPAPGNLLGSLVEIADLSAVLDHVQIEAIYERHPIIRWRDRYAGIQHFVGLVEHIACGKFEPVLASDIVHEGERLAVRAPVRVVRFVDELPRRAAGERCHGEYSPEPAGVDRKVRVRRAEKRAEPRGEQKRHLAGGGNGENFRPRESQ
jgi:hypothetical protein